MAGQEGLEPPTRGFGDRRSTNWSYWPLQDLLTFTPAGLMKTVTYGRCVLFCLLMWSVLFTKFTELLPLKLIRILLLVLHGTIVPVLTNRALEYEKL